MASIIYLGDLFGMQDKIYIHEKYVSKSLVGLGKEAIIAKGNIIEGIEAKE